MPTAWEELPHKTGGIAALTHLRFDGDGAALAPLRRRVPVGLRPLDGVLGQVDGVQQLLLRTGKDAKTVIGWTLQGEGGLERNTGNWKT